MDQSHGRGGSVTCGLTRPPGGAAGGDGGTSLRSRMGHEHFPSGPLPACSPASARRMTTGSLFVGREGVMTLLGAALRGAADGQGATLIIRGDAGHREEQGYVRVGGGSEHGRHANVARRMLPR